MLKGPDQKQADVRPPFEHGPKPLTDLSRTPAPGELNQTTTSFEMRPVPLPGRDGGAALADLQAPAAPAAELATVLRRLREYIEREQREAAPTLREAQVAALSDVLHHLEQGHLRGYLKCPTGFGKTVLFTKLVEALGLPAAVLVPKRLLLDQTEDKFDTFAPGIEVKRIGGGNNNAAQPDCSLTTYQYLQRAAFDGRFDLGGVKLFILDETHKGIGPAGRKLLDAIPKDAIVIGFTATPTYSEEHSVEEALGPCFHELSVPEAIRTGSLAPVRALVVKAKADVSKVKINANGQYDAEELGSELERQGVAQGATKLYKQAFDGQSGICFCGSIKYSESVAKKFNEAGIPAAAISGETPPAEQQRIFKEYAEGKIKILCSADLLIEGFDQPRAQVCFNLVETSSLVSAEQQGGRVMRLDAANPFKVAVVIDFQYSDDRKRTPPVFYVDILGGTACPPAGERSVETQQALEKLEKRLQQLDIPELQIALETQQILELRRNLEPDQLLAPPPDWITMPVVMERSGLPAGLIRRVLESCGGDLDGYTGRFANPANGRAATYYAPEIVEKLCEVRERDPRARGWYPVTALKQRFRTSEAKIEAALESFQDDPANEDKWEIRGHTGRAGFSRAVYYHPDVLDFLRDKFPPDNWARIKLDIIADQHMLPALVVREIYREMQEDFPASCSALTGNGNGVKISPEAVSELHQRINVWLERPVDGKITIKELAAETGQPLGRCLQALQANIKAEAAKLAADVRAPLPEIEALYGGQEKQSTFADFAKEVRSLGYEKAKALLTAGAQAGVEQKTAPIEKQISADYRMHAFEETKIRHLFGPHTSAPQDWLIVSDWSRSNAIAMKDGKVVLGLDIRHRLPPWTIAPLISPQHKHVRDYGHPILKKFAALQERAESRNKSA